MSVSVRGSDVVDARGRCPADFACSDLLRVRLRQGTADASVAIAASPALNVLVVDVQSLLQNSKSAKMVRQQIEQKRSEYAKEISQQEEATAARARFIAAAAGITIA